MLKFSTALFVTRTRTRRCLNVSRCCCGKSCSSKLSPSNAVDGNPNAAVVRPSVYFTVRTTVCCTASRRAQATQTKNPVVRADVDADAACVRHRNAKPPAHQMYIVHSLYLFQIEFAPHDPDGIPPPATLPRVAGACDASSYWSGSDRIGRGRSNSGCTDFE